MRFQKMIVGFGILAFPGALSAQTATTTASAGVEARAEVGAESGAEPRTGGGAEPHTEGRSEVRREDRAEARRERRDEGAAHGGGEARTEGRRDHRSSERADGGEAGGPAAAELSAEARVAIARRAIEGGDGERRATRGEIEAGAAAVASGASEEDIERVRESTPPRRSMEASLRALATLSARGIESGHAAAAISAQLARGASDAALGQMAASARTASHLNAASLGAGAGAAAGLGAAGAAGGALGGATGIGVGLAGAVTGGIRF